MACGSKRTVRLETNHAARNEPKGQYEPVAVLKAAHFETASPDTINDVRGRETTPMISRGGGIGRRAGFRTQSRKG